MICGYLFVIIDTYFKNIISFIFLINKIFSVSYYLQFKLFFFQF